MEKITITEPQRIRIEEDAFPRRAYIEVNDLSLVSDGYHTVAELYDHRITLFIALCRQIERSFYNGDIDEPDPYVWRSKFHSDGKPAFDGWFVMGISSVKDKQITYHLPLSRWDETNFAETLEKAPEYDSHTPSDVLERLKKL